MADEPKKEPWLNWLALSTILLAVCTTFATSRGGGCSSKAMMNQNLASDQWTFFQAKSSKGVEYETQGKVLEAEQEMLELQLLALPAATGDAAKDGYGKTIESCKKKVESCKAQIAIYKTEKAKIKADAEAFEAIRDDAKQHGAPYGQAAIYLQIAVLLSSIAALMKKKPLWIMGMLVGIVGLIYFADGFWLFLEHFVYPQIPWLAT